MGKEYKLIYGNQRDVTNKVNNLLNEGWELHGTPSFWTQVHQNPLILQAMIRDLTDD
jgi:hypothetical protein